MGIQRYEWASDKSRFGLKLMQKMGWKEGNGLGRDEDGRVDIVKPLRQSSMTLRGLQEPQSLKSHGAFATGFNDVLSRLAPIGDWNETNAKGIDDESAKKSDVNGSNEKYSLKESRNSLQNTKERRGFYERRRARKNVAMYSEDDLREIFGSVKEETQLLQKHANDEPSLAPNTDQPLSMPNEVKTEGKKEGKLTTEEIKDFVKYANSIHTHPSRQKLSKVIKKKHGRKCRNENNEVPNAGKLAVHSLEKDEKLRKLIDEVKDR